MSSMHSRVTHRQGRLAVVIAGLALLAAPHPAFAIHNFSNSASNRAYLDCKKTGLNEVECQTIAIAVDPLAVDVKTLELVYNFDATMFTFAEAESGPLGIFSVGGDAPAAEAGVGTMALGLLPETGFSPGAPLPGSTLTYTLSPGTLTISYHLADAVTVLEDTNFLLLKFNFIRPVRLSDTLGTIDYAATGPGMHFTQMSFSCTTVDGSNACGSGSPSTGLSLHLAYVPEPDAWALMLIGFGAIGALLRRGRRPSAERLC